VLHGGHADVMHAHAVGIRANARPTLITHPPRTADADLLLAALPALGVAPPAPNAPRGVAVPVHARAGGGCMRVHARTPPKRALNSDPPSKRREHASRSRR